VFVRQISVDEADEIYEVRAALDEFVGRRLAQMASADDVRDLRGRIERMERAAAKGDVDTYAAAQSRFSRPPWWSSPATRSSSPPTGGSSTN